MYNVYKYIKMVFKKKVIVDCDGGTDDAVSLVILLDAHKKNLIDLKAITCVAGNTDIENVVKNVFRILELCKIDVPVYRGANSSLISIESVLVKAKDFKYHGDDGFGDVLTENVNISNLKKEHAVIALKKIITDNPDQVSVVCLGPLTNIALAVKIYPEILDAVKDFYVMGGNFTGLGNTTSQAEFNFYADPESVHMILQSNTKRMWIFPWETCLKTYIPMIPVYRGADSPLISLDSQILKAADVRYHGHDGFGDVFTDEVDISKLQKDHAVIGLREIITENPDEVSVVCLGPLTNIALAVKIYPEILGSVKDFFIMGGNSAGLGNTTSQAEFNFYADPESVHILLQRNLKPLWLFPWETCLKSNITIDWRENKLGKLEENKKLKLINKIEDGIYKNKLKRETYRPCDAFCVAAVINPKVLTNFDNCHADIELHGVKTRGFMAIDHLRNNKPNINLVSDLDFEEFKTLMIDSFQ